MKIQSQNPATGEVLETFDAHTDAEIDRALEAGHDAFTAWRRVSFAERATHMRQVAKVLRRDAHAHAITMALEMGKPVVQGEAEIEKCAWVCDFYAAHAEAMLAPETIQTEAKKCVVRFDPIGLVLAIMPWNYPFWQVFRFAAPALMTGNGALLKHAPNVTRCGLAIEAAFVEAGFPRGLFKTLLLDNDQVPKILNDRRVQGVTLTGSERAGSSVASSAGAALKKSVLELGGSDPCVILHDADVEKAARTAAESRLVNSGQACIAAKRFIVVESIADRFSEAFVSALDHRVLGDPLDRKTQVGPQARVDLRDALHRQVEQSLARGATALLGAKKPEGPGAFYPVTALASVGEGMAAFDEETFGPVAAIVVAKDEEDAIRLANQTPYGLGAAIWTEDRERAETIVPRIEAGCIFVNALVKSDPRVPFGGVKRSGYGRELGEYGLREFSNAKSVWIE